MHKETIWLGSDDIIYTNEGKNILWEEYNLIYIGGVHAFRVIDIDSRRIIELWEEDDGSFYKTDVEFHVDWLQDLENLISETYKKLDDKDV